MRTKDFFGKFFSKFLVGNLLAMLIVVILAMFGVKYGLEWYTHHGEGIEVPKLEGKKFSQARAIIDDLKLNIVVSDSGFNKKLPADCILMQNPGYGTKVKQGHTIYVTVNSPSSPSFAIPDVVDNSSYREAAARLMAIGFKLLEPQMVPGEKDWVYGIICDGKKVSAGERISIDHPLTLMIGNGQYQTDDDEVEPEYRMMEEDNPNELEKASE
ncbi:MAG: PASTA domain-containing protein [Prevotella sp.]|nr:PASTA domain-containing protein [Prevotella sp.]